MNRGTDSNKAFAEPIFRRLREKLQRDAARGAIIPGPEPMSGWTHNFTCSRCAERLPFDPDGGPPFVCPTCDVEHDDPDRREAWLTQLNSHQVRAALDCTRFPEDRDLLQYARDVLVGYARAYPDYIVHGRWAGKGRLQGQSLTEAVWMLPAVQASHRLGRLGVTTDAEQRDVAAMFRGAIELLTPQMGQVHNIHVWIASAVAAMAVVTEDTEAFDRAEQLLARNLAEGVLPDGTWYEGSPQYQLYTVQAFLSYATAMQDLGREPRFLAEIARMARQPVRLLTVEGRIAGINDGWPVHTLRGRAPLYEVVHGLVGGFEDVLGTCYHQLGVRRDSVEAAVFGPAELPADARIRPARLDLVDGVAVARRDGLVVLVKANPDGGGHDHPDKPMLAIHSVSPRIDAGDLANPGYGNPLHGGWFKKTAAHNTVVIDGGDHQPGAGEVTRVEEAGACSIIEARREEAVPGVRIVRSVVVGDGWVLDRTAAEAEVEHDLCWRFHAVADLHGPEGEPCEFLPNPYVTQQRKLAAGEELDAVWQGDGGGRLYVRCWRPAGADFCAARAPALPATRHVDLLAVVGRTRRLVVEAVFSSDPLEVRRERGAGETVVHLPGVVVRIDDDGRVQV